MRKSSNKELKKLSRAELLELLLEQSKELEEVTRERDQYKAAYEDRRINIDNAGSIAEAALKLSGIFEAAQKAADEYLQGVTGEAPKEEKEETEKQTEEEEDEIRFEEMPDTSEDSSADASDEDEYFDDDDDEGIKFEFDSL